MAKNFKDLSEREILALAISLEEEHGRIFGDFADGFRRALARSRQGTVCQSRRRSPPSMY